MKCFKVEGKCEIKLNLLEKIYLPATKPVFRKEFTQNDQHRLSPFVVRCLAVCK